jgi:hypothetical protein
LGPTDPNAGNRVVGPSWDGGLSLRPAGEARPSRVPIGPSAKAYRSDGGGRQGLLPAVAAWFGREAMPASSREVIDPFERS